MSRQIFRQAALERLSSPEQLDQLMSVTTLRGWLRSAVTVDLPPLPTPRALLREPAQLFRPLRQPRPRVKTPTVLQMEAVECGAASLAIILGYFGRIVPLEELRTACGVSRDGTKASNIVKAAAGYGVRCRGFRRETADLPSLPLPFVVFWNFNHFLVVEGFGKDCVYLNDPACGPRTVSQQELDEGFTGVVLVFERSPDFRTGGARPSLVAALRQRLRGTEGGLAYVALVSFVLVMLGLAVPTLTRVFVDRYLVQRLTDWVPLLLLGMAAIAAAVGALTWAQQSYLLRLETRLSVQASRQFLWHVLRLPIEFFTQRFGGEVVSRVQLNDAVAQLLTRDLATTTIAATMVVFYAALMFQYDAALTLLGIVFAGLNLLALLYVSRKRTDGHRKLLHESGKLLGTAMNGLQTIETIKATGAENDFFTRWSGYFAKVANAKQESDVLTSLLAVIPALLTALATIAILAVGGLRVIDGYLTVGMLVAFQAMMVGFLRPVNSLVNLGGTLQEVEGQMSRLQDVLHNRVDRLAAADDRATDAEPARLSGQVELRNLTFGYSRLEPPLIEDFTATLAPGARMALVGASGSGKSTIGRLVVGLFEPWHGEILFDGQPRSDLPPHAIKRSLALVDQGILLFEGTITENLTLWDGTIPAETIVQAARDACIHDDIVARPDGYQWLVEEDGRNLSGGQRQRLEIARALVGEPSVLVLDEATSALDPVTEHIINENLRRRGCTCLIIAHRLSTVRDCDEIIVLDSGRVVQRGTHKTLREVPGPYAELIRADM